MEEYNPEDLSLDDSLFVGVTYDLSLPIFLSDKDYQTADSMTPEVAYIINIHHRVQALATRIESLNIVYKLLSIKDFPVPTLSGAISRESWVRITLDVLLSRLTSIRDCVFLLISEVFDLRVEPKNVSRYQLKNDPVISSIRSLNGFIDDIANIGRSFRDERDLHMHRGEERPLGQEPDIYYIASAFEAIGLQKQENEASGNPFDLDKEHRKIIGQLEIEFKSTADQLNNKVHQLLDLIYPYFKETTLNKFDISGNSNQVVKGLMERAEFYYKYNGNRNIDL